MQGQHDPRDTELWCNARTHAGTPIGMCLRCPCCKEICNAYSIPDSLTVLSQTSTDRTRCRIFLAGGGAPPMEMADHAPCLTELLAVEVSVVVPLSRALDGDVHVYSMCRTYHGCAACLMLASHAHVLIPFSPRQAVFLQL